MERKHSYRQLDKRKFNKYILLALQNEEEVIRELKFWSKYTDKSYIKLVGMLKTALQVAKTMRKQFEALGKNMILGNYEPYTKEIKQELFKINQLELF